MDIEHLGRTTLIVAVLLAAAPTLHAYIDPGAGSIILQVILGGLAGVGVAWKLLWHRLRGKEAQDANPDSQD